MGSCSSKNSVMVSTPAAESISDANSSTTGKYIAPSAKSAHKKPPLAPGSAPTSDATDGSRNQEELGGNRGRFASYASGASTPELHSSDDECSTHSAHSSKSGHQRHVSNPKMLSHSTSAIGLDTMIEDRREVGDLRQNMVHIEVPFGKPIEEVYEGIHNGPVLGSGISGLVRLATHKKTGLKYAVKVLDLALVETAEGLRQLREEIFIMCQLDHPNIVRLEEVYESHSEIYLVQELCLGGELFDRLDEQPDYHYTEGECARLVKQMLSAVRYLHSKGIIHRDLKLENFLFSSTVADSELKMIDFGLSKHFRYGEVQHEAVGTPYTVAPEVIHGSYDERCDIWAIGVITFLLLSGDPPFGGCGGPESLMQVRQNILTGTFAFEPPEIWSRVSTTARAFIRALLVTDPKKRPTARTAQKHKWLQEWASRSRNGEDNVLNPNVVKALVNFKEFSDMRKLLCEVLSFTLLPEQIIDLRREFEKMDTDGSGEISLSALKQVLMMNAGAGSLGALTEEEVEDIFNAMRVRKTETRIHWHEFIAAGLSQCQVDDRNLRLAFDRLDSDHKGYITLDDIMDLMGSDGVQSEDNLRQMWGDSMKAVKCQHARITYDDFLLLMKGQTKEAPPGTVAPVEVERSDVGGNVMSMLENSKLFVVQEDLGENLVGEKLLLDTDDEEEAAPGMDIDNSSHTPVRHTSGAHSAPTTPAGYKRNVLEFENGESPFTARLDDAGDANIESCGPGVPGSSAALTPPASPQRGPNDYVTPVFGRRTHDLDVVPGLTLPGLSGKPDPYQRRRSRSVDDREKEELQDSDLHAVADVARHMIVPEAGHGLDAVVRDSHKSALVVNRQLYRAHRQMRLAVLEASKRFEEEQARHAREYIMAHSESTGDTKETVGMIQAGLVMRHGQRTQVSSEAIRAMLKENEVQQQALVEKANRRGGRGRRSRKKTISDMSGLLSSLGQDEMGLIAKAASISPDLYECKSMDLVPEFSGTESEMFEDGSIGRPTVPGEFRHTTDPFSRDGRYGHTSVWNTE